MAKCDKIRIMMVEYSKNLGGNYMGIYCKILCFAACLQIFLTKCWEGNHASPFTVTTTIKERKIHILEINNENIASRHYCQSFTPQEKERVSQGNRCKIPFTILWEYMPAQSCPTLCNSMDCSRPGSSVHRTSQAGRLEWVVISSSRGSFWPRDHTCISCFSCIGRRILYHWATWEALFTLETCPIVGKNLLNPVPKNGGGEVLKYIKNKSIWPLNKGLNCIDPLIHRVFSMVNTTVLYHLQLVDSSDTEPWIESPNC